MHQYSEKLIGELIKNFKEEHNLEISKETANEYLDSYARLFITFSKIEKRTKHGSTSK
ncbi:MAG TPA: hypothetical protein VGO21_04145 [Candidatus Paceibacterota bacterium]|jgi:hypothetical protein|nr:hypothetical protein [Candidatus Paceibacterota bacterium]